MDRLWIYRCHQNKCSSGNPSFASCVGRISVRFDDITAPDALCLLLTPTWLNINQGVCKLSRCDLNVIQRDPPQEQISCKGFYFRSEVLYITATIRATRPPWRPSFGSGATDVWNDVIIAITMTCRRRRRPLSLSLCEFFMTVGYNLSSTRVKAATLWGGERAKWMMHKRVCHCVSEC